MSLSWLEWMQRYLSGVVGTHVWHQYPTYTVARVPHSGILGFYLENQIILGQNYLVPHSWCLESWLNNFLLIGGSKYQRT